MMHGNQDVVSDCAVGPVLIVMLSPTLQLFLGICKAHELMRVQAFPRSLLLKASMKPVSVGLPGRKKPNVTSFA